MSYAGWANYETWRVNACFLEPENYPQWQEIARQCKKGNAGKAVGPWAEDGIHELSKQMQESILDGVPVGLGMYSDMVGKAVEQVDFHAIAKAFIESIDV